MSIYILIILELTLSFIIKTRSDGRYLKASTDNKLKTVRDIYNATIFKAKNIGASPEHIVLQKENSKLVWETLRYGSEIGLRKFNRKKSQIFRIILDTDGYYQIGQGEQSYLGYDYVLRKFNMTPNRNFTEQGFILITDDGKREYPHNIPNFKGKAQKSMEDDYLNQMIFPFMTRGFMYD